MNRVSFPASVLLDIDDTLLDFHKAEAVALSRTLSELGIELKGETLARYSDINRQQWELLEEGKLSREQVLLRRFELLFRELGADCDAAWARDRYEGLLCIGHWFVPGAEALLRSLHGRYGLYIVSNGTGAVQSARIESAGIGPYFRDIFISEDLGADKPSAEFFRRCFARAPEIDPARCLILGDSLTSDIRGGINAGIRTCWFNPLGKPGRADIVPDFTIQALPELPPLLARLYPAG